MKALNSQMSPKTSLFLRIMAEKKEVKDANSKRTKFHEIWSWQNTEIKFEKLPTRLITFNTKWNLSKKNKLKIWMN